MCSSTLADANAKRPAEVFTELFAAMVGGLQRGLRRSIGECVHLIDSTSIRLNAYSADWAQFSAAVCGVKAHVIYDAEAERPVYLAVTPTDVNDITAAKEMPIEPGATYVFDLGYYDYAWWARLHEAGCRIVTRLKTNTPLHAPDARRFPRAARSSPTASACSPHGWPRAGATRCTSRCGRSR